MWDDLPADFEVDFELVLIEYHTYPRRFHMEQEPFPKKISLP